MNDDPIFSDVGANQQFKWNYVLKNYGISPALRARGHARSYILRGGWHDWGTIKRDIEALDLLPNSENTIFNGGESPDSGGSNVLLSPEINDEIQNGKSLIVLGGRIEYFDGAGTQHNTTWCIIYLPDPIGAKKMPRWHSCPINPIAD
jgi:hypothetical protein